MSDLTEVGPDITVSFPVVTEAGFPHGVQCPVCSLGISVGQPYADHLVGVYSDGSVITLLTCVYCKVP